MHKSLKDIDIIGWDIVVSGDRYYFLEGNIFAGGIISRDKEYARKAKKFINWIPVNSTTSKILKGEINWTKFLEKKFFKRKIMHVQK